MKKTREVKRTYNFYSIQVWDNKYNRYVNWGIEYNNKQQAIDTLKDYLQDCLKINSDYYLKQYKSYTSKPIKILSRTETITTKDNEDEYMEAY